MIPGVESKAEATARNVAAAAEEDRFRVGRVAAVMVMFFVDEMVD